MENLDLLHMPPMEPLAAAHLHPKSHPSTVSRSPSLPSKSDRFQSALTEKAYKAAALSVLSLLTAYQAELCEHFGQTQDPATWEKIPVITNQATGRALGNMVLQERARWVNLANLSNREGVGEVLDIAVVQEGIFGSVLASMQRRYEAKKKEDEALLLCPPQKPGQVEEESGLTAALS